LSTAYTEEGRRAEVIQTTRLHARAAYALLRAQQPTEALLKLEQGKTRLLSQALALIDVDLAMLPEAQQGELREARRRVRELEAEMRLPPDTPARRDDRELADLLHRARTELGGLIEAIRKVDPDFMPAGLDLSSILALVPAGGALLAPLVTLQGSAVFVLPKGTQSVDAGHVVSLEGFTDERLHELLLGPEDDIHHGGWMGACSSFLDGGPKASLKEWCAAIDGVTRQLWDAVMGPVHDRLQESGLTQGAPVLLMPQGGLGLLPLHAAWREVDAAKRPFLDDYTVTYAPSAYALRVARHRLDEPQRLGASLLAVVNPTGDLRHTPREGKTVAAHFEAGAQSVLVGAEATQEAVMAQAPGRCYLHFACHGFYHWQDPMASALLLAGSDPATPKDPFELREILSPHFDLSAARLVTLSACETGLTEFQESPDEYIGLPSGFLQAGAPAVVSSLWAVDDFSTSLLMGEFYRRHLEEGEGIAEALRDAELWLRDLDRDTALDLVEPLWDEAQQEDPALFGAIDSLYWALLQGGDEYEHPFAHPYYWGAFTASGAV
jgi:CHAT domain-containing protein